MIEKDILKRMEKHTTDLQVLIANERKTLHELLELLHSWQEGLARLVEELYDD